MLFKNVADNFVLNDTKQRIVEIAYNINTRMKSNEEESLIFIVIERIQIYKR